MFQQQQIYTPSLTRRCALFYVTLCDKANGQTKRIHIKDMQSIYIYMHIPEANANDLLRKYLTIG